MKKWRNKIMMNQFLKHWFAWQGIDITPFKYDNKPSVDKKTVVTRKVQKKMDEKKKQNQKPKYFKKTMKASMA
nr:MAG TPA: hypothetical protein [Caudoviricetes sp.]